MNVLINYSNEAYRSAQEKNSSSAKRVGFDKIIQYSPADIDFQFYADNKRILDMARGNGLWLWKPYIVQKTLNQVEDGDIVFYCDSGALFFRSPKAVFNILEKQDIWVSVLPLIEKQFTKKMAFELMGLTEKKYTDTPQISGSFLAVKKTSSSMKFVNEWLMYCCNWDILSPVTDKSKEVDMFYDHREDQSVLSLLVKKYDIKAYSDPSQFGRLPEKYGRKECEMKYYGHEDYKPFVLHHRTKDVNKKVLLNQWLCAVLPRRIGLKLIRKN